MKHLLLTAIRLSLVPALMFAADARRGETVLDQQGCLYCHTVQGQAAGHEILRPAPELSARITSHYTVASLASLVWNHSPEMWRRLASADVTVPAAQDSDWRDLFAYLYSLQFADLPGETSRGAKVFESKRCSACHSVGAPPERRATPAQEWAAVREPVDLLYQMWTHAATMHLTKSSGGVEWEKLSSRDLMDLAAYAQSQQKRSPNSYFTLPPADAQTRKEYENRCFRCHQGVKALDRRLKNHTWMDIGAALWNHAPQMPSGAATTKAQMAGLIAYVWELQYSGAPGGGNSVKGAEAFRAKGCIVCHKEASGSPKNPIAFDKEKPAYYSPFTMLALSWGKGREMHAKLAEQGARWPQLSAEDMADLAAFLNTLR